MSEPGSEVIWEVTAAKNILREFDDAAVSTLVGRIHSIVAPEEELPSYAGQDDPLIRNTSQVIFDHLLRNRHPLLLDLIDELGFDEFTGLSILYSAELGDHVAVRHAYAILLLDPNHYRTFSEDAIKLRRMSKLSSIQKRSAVVDRNSKIDSEVLRLRNNGKSEHELISILNQLFPTLSERQLRRIVKRKADKS